MKKRGIFYGSTTGHTEQLAEKIATLLGIEKTDIHNVMNTKVEAVEPYEMLLLGCSTWGASELQDDWNDFLFHLKDKKLNGKMVALFGYGNSLSHGNSFCDALGLIHKELQQTGCKFIGETESEGYTFEHSAAFINGKFTGLALDESQPEKNEERIRTWVEKIKHTR